MDRDEFMELVYETFADEPDNVLANGIIEAADAYVEHEKAQLSPGDTTSDQPVATDTNVGDKISRKAALDIFDDYNVSVENGELEAYSRDRKRMCELPTIQPETPCYLGSPCEYQNPDVVISQPEPQWVLCDERMPEEHEWIGTKKFGTTISDEVYVTFENEKGERFCKHMTFQNGELSRYDKAYMEAWYKGSKPIAWMPLPEPYKLNK